MKPNRIAIISDRFPPNWGGGIASAHYQLYRVLAKQGLEVKAFSFFDGPADGNESVNVVRRSAPHSLVRFLRRANNLAFRIVDSGKAAYQVADVLVRAWGARRLNGALAEFAPEVMVFPDHGSPALWIRPLDGCRRVLIAHHNPDRFHDLPHIEAHSARDIRMAVALENRVLCSIDKVICPSAYMKEIFSGTYRFDGSVEVLPNMVDDDFLDEVQPADPRPLLGLPADATLVYIPGGGNKFKGSGLVFDLLRDIAEGRSEPFGVYISGAVGSDLKDRLSGLTDRVRLHAPGPLDGPANMGHVRSCSFVLYPTLVENYSMALLEAALCGVPMVTFDVGGNSEIVIDGVNGFLVPPYDLNPMAAAAVRLLDPATARKMGADTLKDARQRLSAGAVAEKYVKSLTSFENN